MTNDERDERRERQANRDRDWSVLNSQVVGAEIDQPASDGDPKRLAQLEAVAKLVLEWRRAQLAYRKSCPTGGGVCNQAADKLAEAEIALEDTADALLLQRKEGV